MKKEQYTDHLLHSLFKDLGGVRIRRPQRGGDIVDSLDGRRNNIVIEAIGFNLHTSIPKNLGKYAHG